MSNILQLAAEMGRTATELHDLAVQIEMELARLARRSLHLTERSIDLEAEARRIAHERHAEAVAQHHEGG